MSDKKKIPKSLDIDPKYAKAWARLASAEEVNNFVRQVVEISSCMTQGLKSFEKAVEAWRSAVDAISGFTLTASEQKQREQHQAHLSAAIANQVAYDTAGNAAITMSQSNGDMPWKAAARLIPLYTQTMPRSANSSVCTFANPVDGWNH